MSRGRWQRRPQASLSLRPLLAAPLSSRLLVAAYVVLSVAYLVWAQTFPVSIFTNAGLDDALFWTRAESIVDGGWLGAYDDKTLAKGPGFSLVLAANHLLGLPITLTVAVLYLLGCLLVTRALTGIGMHRSLAFATFVVILFHPAVLPTRVIRDDIYPALALLLLAGALRVLAARGRGVRSVVLTAVLGAAAGLLWVTREEGVWILPGVALLMVAGVLGARRDRPVLVSRLVHGLAYVLAGTAVVGVLALVNLSVYGKLVVTDFQGASFSAALSSLNGVRVGPEVPYVPVPEKKRSALYEASPAFAELRTNLDGGDNPWKDNGCAIYPQSCGDFAGGWWVWALRDAVASRGYYATPAKADAFYERLTREVERGCRSGTLTCDASSVPFMPTVTDQQLAQIPATAGRAVDLLTLDAPVGANTVPSWEPLGRLREVRAFLGHPRSNPAVAEHRRRVSGWFHAADHTWISLVCVGTDGEVVRHRVRRQPSPDLVGTLGDRAATDERFSFRVPADVSCQVRRPPGRGHLDLASATAPGAAQVGDDATFTIDSIEAPPTPPTITDRVVPRLGAAYHRVLSVLAPLGVAALVLAIGLALATRRRAPGRWTGLLLPALAVWGLVSARIAVLTLVDISSFPAINTLYMSAGFPLLVIACMLSIQALVSEVVRLRSRVGGPADS